MHIFHASFHLFYVFFFYQRIEVEPKWLPVQRHFDIFKLFLCAIGCILIQISLRFVPNCPINNTPALVQIMTWCRIGDKQSSEPNVVPTKGTTNVFTAVKVCMAIHRGSYAKKVRKCGHPETCSAITLRPRENGRHSADVFKFIFMNDNCCI